MVYIIIHLFKICLILVHDLLKVKESVIGPTISSFIIFHSHVNSLSHNININYYYALLESISLIIFFSY